ncbi:MAG: phosphoenolpyruvate--protein phosphotransferase, partial [Negativicutes bacterium]|nr:phosphoenolpyruvate--protein phosphotransferase [Negativicutes bacterium]
LGLGSTTSHAVIIAKSRGIVTVVGLQDSVLTMPDGQPAVVDGYTGQVWVNPGENLLGKYQQLLVEEENRRKRDLESASLPSVTLDGVRVQLAANVGLPSDIDGAIKLGAEGVGLFRTEFLFMGKNQPPSEDEQYEAYKYVIEACGAHLCVIRTMDIGGDKKLGYLQVPHEENPFLGYRAIRICLERPDVFLPQLKAILRAGVHGRAAIMLPMVINIEEVRRAREFLNQAADELMREGKEFDRSVPLGIMVETPAAAINAPNLAKEVDFFSIGTNDLCQYTLAVDRMNPKISALYDHFNPAVLRAIYNTIQASHQANIWTGMCGEMASDPLAAALLVGMGIDELSMNAPAVPRVKEMIRSINAGEAEAIVETVLNMDSGAEVRAFLAKTFAAHTL